MPWVNAPDVSIHYEWINPTCKENGILVFIHEALGSIGQWKEFPSSLCNATGLAGLVYERQGHGNSQGFTEIRRTNYLHDYAIIELPAVLEALHIHCPVTLVGHSDGGSIALLFASAFPQRVNGLISMAAHVFVEKETLEGIQPAVDIYEPVIREKLKKYHPNEVDELFFAWANTWQSEAFRKWNITKELEKVNCPVLALQGDTDEYGTSAQLEAIKESCSGKVQTMLIQNCRHIPFLQQPEVTLETISEFIDTLKQKSEL